MIDREEILALATGEALDESRMDPFKRKARLGPGPRGRKHAKRRKDRFKCKCTSMGSGSECKCKHKAGVKTVYVSYDYKNDYNRDYRAWARKKAANKKSKKPGIIQKTIGALKKIVGL